MPIHVILTEDVQHLGIAGQVVRVKDGYARNYLMPRGMALLATEGRVRELEHRKRVIDDKQKKEIAGHQDVARRLSKVSLEFVVHAGEEGKLFGSVTNVDIHQQLVAQGFDVERRKIQLPDPIKQLGSYDVSVRLHREVIPTVKVTVIAADGPPPGQVEEDLDETEDEERIVRADEDEDDD
jgi:large subunit ribosomal protein L9